MKICKIKKIGTRIISKNIHRQTKIFSIWYLFLQLNNWIYSKKRQMLEKYLKKILSNKVKSLLVIASESGRLLDFFLENHS